MNHIALHILQPFPATCLNRDDVGAPKTLIFGGVTRARVSSQCWKRQIRLTARESLPGYFAGDRTLRIAEDLARLLQVKGVGNAAAIASFVCQSLVSKSAAAAEDDESGESDGDDPAAATDETKTLLYLSPGEVGEMAKAVFSHEAEIATVRDLDAAQLSTVLNKKKPKPEEKLLKKAAKCIRDAAAKAVNDYGLKDAADIAIFGRMVANDPSLTMEGAGLFAHAFSTHKCDNDLDFWTAVDDRKQSGDDAGAANMGHAEFNSACYYRYVALNLDQLYFQKSTTGDPTANLKEFLKEKLEVRRAIVSAFLRAALLAVPSAKQNSMNGHMLPEFALGLVSTGQPFQLANAFESPVRANGNGWLLPSIEVLEKHHAKLKRVFGLQSLIREEVRLSEETPLDTFIEKLVAYVH